MQCGLLAQYTSYRSLMNLMTHTGMTLCDIALLPDDEFISVMGGDSIFGKCLSGTHLA